MKELAKQIKEELIKLTDEKYKEFHSNLCPGVSNIIGVRVPILRNYAKDLLKKYSIEELLSNIKNEYYEEIMLQGMLIGLSKETDFTKIKKYIEEFIPKIDNWAVCDTFCASLKITKKHKEEMWEFLEYYIKSNEEFEIRFAVVMILDYYIEEQYINEIFQIFNNISSTKYYVQMAIAWALSFCFICYYEETKKYFKSSKCNLDNFTYNKAIQKARESFRITKQRKKELNEMKKNIKI